MTFQEFDEFQNRLIEQVVEMKNTKGKEYANSESRFANFDRLAVRLNIKPTAVALVYLTKHLDSIESYIKNGQTYSTESIQGRIVDAITYLTLIAGMIEEDLLIQDDLKVKGILIEEAVEANLIPEMQDQNQGKHQPFEFDPARVLRQCYYCTFTGDEKELAYHYTLMPDHKR